MGYIQHDAVIVVTTRHSLTLELLDFRQSLIGSGLDPYLVGPVHAANIYESWIFAPDGSKEGWEFSDKANAARARFEQIAVAAGADVVHVRFGGDYGMEMGARIVWSTDGAWQDKHSSLVG
jgi:hypothetical protein